MSSSLNVFRDNMAAARALATMHNYLHTNIKSPMSFDDLLRFQIVYAVSALDKLVHDIIRDGMVKIFMGLRPATNKYLNEKISLSAYITLASATMPPKEHYFEQEIISKFAFVSFQSPDSISDGLSYVWEEKHKWQRIAESMSVAEHEARTRLKLIVDRRNKIAHEADIDITSGGRVAISAEDCHSAIDFVESCGLKMLQLVEL